jgi:hypothetical protein
VRAGVCCITNCDPSDKKWLKAILPVNNGGIGIGVVTMLALSAYFASEAGTQPIQDQIFKQIHILLATGQCDLR